MNYEELEKDITLLESDVKGLNITNQQEFEQAKLTSQALSKMTIELGKFIDALGRSNKDICAKMDAFSKKNPDPNKCVACQGTGKDSKNSQCKPCKGTGKKQPSTTSSVGPEGGPRENNGLLTPMPAPEISSTQQAPSPVAPVPATPEPAPALNLDSFDEFDDFDLAPVKEEDALAAEIAKCSNTLF